jgi:lysophospholipid acyltransferase (LPLAT)-like uncharacterized protein
VSLAERAVRAVVGGGGRLLLQLLAASWRLRVVVGDERAPGIFDRERPAIYVFWHAHLLPLTWAHRDRGVVGLVSRHRDGEYIAGVMRAWGYGTARGSSTRGGSAGLRQVVRALRSGASVGITPDGPRGPARMAKPGAIAAARLTGAPIVPVAAAARRHWRLGSWDGFIIPRPFTRLLVGYGEPIDPGTAAGSLDELAATVTRRLDALGAELDTRSHG